MTATQVGGVNAGRDSGVVLSENFGAVVVTNVYDSLLRASRTAASPVSPGEL